MAPKLSDAELVTLAVMQALLGFSSQACWLRYADRHLRTCSPICPARRATPSAWSGGAAATAGHPGDRHRPQPVDRRCLAGRLHPLEGGRSQETTKRSALAGWAQYGSCASHSRSLWGLRLQLVGTLHGLAIRFALTGAKADEREVLVDLLGVEPELVAARGGRRCWPTSTPPAAAWSGSWPGWACDGWGRPARASRRGLAQTCSNRCGS